MQTSKHIILLLIYILLQSCTKPVDFNQIDDASIQSSYIATLIYLDLETKNFLDTFNQEIEFTADLIENPLNSSSKTYLEKAEFTVKTENTFNRDFTFHIVFFNEEGNQIYQLQEVTILANTLETTTVLEIPESDIDVLFIAKYIGFVVAIKSSNDGSVILPNDMFKLHLKSSVKLYFNFKNQ